MGNVQEIAEKWAQSKKQMTEELRREFEPELMQFFIDNPTLAEVRWPQYAPYFNDGDECIFSVHEPTITFADGSEFEYLWQTPKTKAEELWHDIADLLQTMPKKVMKDMYGTDVEVVVTREGIEVRDYSGNHD